MNTKLRLLFINSMRSCQCSRFIQTTFMIRNEEIQKEKSEIWLKKDQITMLEKLSGIRFRNDDEIRDLQEDIELADKVFEIDTTGVEPLYSITEETVDCPLREDEPVVTKTDKVFQNAPKTMEGFFVSPSVQSIQDRDK